MAHIDVFNGDADGLCALLQLRHAYPTDARLITGVKRDIALVGQAGIQGGDRVTVLDVSFDKNRDAVLAALDAGAEVFYVDHHFAGEVPDHDRLEAIINPAADVCTSLLVDQYLDGRFVEWAIVGAFGDNLDASARALASKRTELAESALGQLKQLGVYLNYNGYGATVEDLHFPPLELFQLLRPFQSPFEFLRDGRGTFEQLESGYRDDMQNAAAIEPRDASARTAVFVFPDTAWARRVSGVYSNDLANTHPGRAHAVVTERADGTYLVSVRAPLENRVGADELCRRFPTGGGRRAAAGINALPGDQLEDFVAQFSEFYRSGAGGSTG